MAAENHPGVQAEAEATRILRPGAGAAKSRATYGRALAAVVAIGLVVSAAASAAATRQAASQATSRLVVSAEEGKPTASLFSLSPAGGALHKLTSTKAHQTQPVLSPNGKEVAFVQAQSATCDGCSSSIWVVNAHGSGARQLSAPLPGTVSYDTSPSWSPDGSQVVFCRQTNISDELYLASATGGTPRNLFIQGVTPAWGPTRIAYLSPPTQAPGPVALWTMNPDGSNPKKITSAYAVALAWSKSGSLAYLDQPPTARSTLVVITAGVFHRYPLPISKATSLSWSPDGTHLAIVGQAAGATSGDVFSIGADGTGLKQLTKNTGALGVTWGS